ncbi:phage head completion protein, partial [Stenotrophomonas maltophilia]
QDLFTVRAEFRPLSGRAMAEAGSLTDAIQGTLVVRDTPRTRALTIADRVTVDGRDYAIESAPPGDRSGWLYLKVSLKKGSA